MVIQHGINSLVIVEKGTVEVIYSSCAIFIGVICIFLNHISSLPTLIPVGMFFLGVGIVVLLLAENRSTTLLPDGNVTILYKRIIGNKRWVRRLNRKDIKTVDYIECFTKNRLGSARRSTSYIYFNVVFGEQIEIGSRYFWDWKVMRRAKPLNSEAAEIGDYLHIAVNTIDYLSAGAQIKNFYNPNDKMRPMLQRPTQQQLDHERD